jgi:hypothetical protein
MAENWLELAAEAQVELKGAGADKARGRAAVNEFASWAQGQGLEFPPAMENADDVLSRYTATLDRHRKADGKWSKNGESAVAWAKELLKRSRVVKEEIPELPTNTEAEVTNEEELDDDMDDVDDEGGEEEVEEAPPKRSRQRAAAAPPNIIVQMPSQRQKAPNNRAVPGKAAPTSKLIPRTDKIRLYKRDERGKRVQIDEYTAEDFAGQTLPDFITSVVHPRFANEGGLPTEYIAFEVNPRSGQDHGAPFKLELEGDENEQPQQTNDPFTQVHRAMGLMKELRGEPEQRESNPAMQQMMQNKAAQGDMTGVLMAMMMDKMFNAPKPAVDNEILLKILDRLDGKGAQPPMQPPPWMMQPPPAPAPVSHASDRIIDLAMAKLVAPEKSAFDMAKEMAQVQQMLTGGANNPEVAALRQEIASLRASQGRPPPGGLEDSMKTFEQVVTMAKSIAPQVGAGDSGGFGGFIKSLLTPDVAKAIAGVVGGAAPQAPAAPVQVAPAPTAAPARDPKQPPRPAPQAVTDAAKAFLFAQTPPARAERFAEYLISMFMANDPYYTALLTPAAQALSAPEITLETLKPARGLGLRLIAELKPEWATPEFTDVCLAALAGKLEAQVPDVLAKSAGAWTLDFRGNVLMLETVAKPVVAAEVGAPAVVEAKVVEAVEVKVPDPAPSEPPVVEGYVPHEPYVPAKATPRERPLRNGLVQLTETTGAEMAQAVVEAPVEVEPQPTA